MRQFLIFLVMVFSSLQSASAQKVDCKKAQSTYEINYCTGLEYEKVDKKLNELYQSILKQIKSSEAGPPPYNKENWEKAFRVAQREWIKFRDADCKGTVPFEWTGGTGTTSAVLECMIRKTEARIKELKTRYHG